VIPAELTLSEERPNDAEERSIPVQETLQKTVRIIRQIILTELRG